MRKTNLLFAIFISLISIGGKATSNYSPVVEKVTIKVEITATEITNYLIETGHTVISNPITRDGGQIWSALTNIKNDGHTYLSVVTVDGENIVDFQDTMVD